MVMNFGGIASLLNVISCSKTYPSSPAVVALGYMCAMSPILALAVIQSKVIDAFSDMISRFNATLNRSKTVAIGARIGKLKVGGPFNLKNKLRVYPTFFSLQINARDYVMFVIFQR